MSNIENKLPKKFKPPKYTVIEMSSARVSYGTEFLFLAVIVSAFATISSIILVTVLMNNG